MQPIGFLLYNFENGGAQNIMIKTANLLSDKYTVKLFIINNQGPLIKRVDKKIEIVPLNKQRLRSSFFELVKVINIHQPQFFISTLLAPSLLLIVANFFSSFKTKILYREASSPSLEPIESLKKKTLKILGKMLLPFSYRVIAVSEGVKEDLIKFYKLKSSKIEVIYNPVFSLQDVEISKIKRKPIDKSQLSIIFVGRIAKVKRIELQLKAIAILVSKNINVRYTIAGNATDIEYYKKLQTLAKALNIEKNINWLGYVDNVENIMQQHQVLLLTSEYEGFPSVLVEGLIAGLHVISCDCPNGPGEILNNGKIGKLINKNECTPEMVANHILALTNNSITINDDYSLLSYFSKEQIFRKYLNIFEN